MSQITTHILDTSIGKPAADVSIILQQKSSSDWQTVAQGVTNNDGRVANLLPKEKVLDIGEYKLIFEVESYFAAQKTTAFYTTIEIRFYIRDNNHYHVPLLLNPFGYSTYRGS